MDLGVRLAPLRPPSSPGLDLISPPSLLYPLWYVEGMCVPSFRCPTSFPVADPSAHPPVVHLLLLWPPQRSRLAPWPCLTSHPKLAGVSTQGILYSSKVLPAPLPPSCPGCTFSLQHHLGPGLARPPLPLHCLCRSYNLPSRAPQPLLLPQNPPRFIQLRWLVPMPPFGLASAMSSGGSGLPT